MQDKKSLADGMKGIMGIAATPGLTEAQRQEEDDLLPYVPLSGEIKIVEDHFICEFGCKTFIRHSPDQVGKLVESLLEKFLSKKPEEE